MYDNEFEKKGKLFKSRIKLNHNIYMYVTFWFTCIWTFDARDLDAGLIQIQILWSTKQLQAN